MSAIQLLIVDTVLISLGYFTPCIFTGDNKHRDMLLLTADNCLYILQLGFPIESQSPFFQAQFRPLFNDLNTDYRQAKLVNLSVSCLGISGLSSDSILEICRDIDMDRRNLNDIITKPPSLLAPLHITSIPEINPFPARCSILLLGSYSFSGPTYLRLLFFSSSLSLKCALRESGCKIG